VPMDHEYKTLELANVYESQKYYQDALDIYVSLNRKYQGKDLDILAACNRMENMLEKDNPPARETGGPDPLIDGQLIKCLEEWLILLIMQNRKTALDELMLQCNPGWHETNKNEKNRSKE
jgi:hypothetical protein